MKPLSILQFDLVDRYGPVFDELRSTLAACKQVRQDSADTIESKLYVCRSGMFMYLGQSDLGAKHGIGTITGDDGSKLVAEFQDGKLNGRVEFVSPQLEFAGMFAQGVLKMVRTLESQVEPGESYQGNVSNYKPHGFGRLVETVQGKRVETFGKFVNGLKEGVCKVKSEGYMFVGTYKSNHRMGPGKLSTMDCEIFGNWVNDRVSDMGYIRSKGTIYKGEITDGKRHGIGVIEKPNSSYMGQFSNDAMEGIGRESVGKEKYIGEFKDGLRSGFGVSTNSATGHTYTGSWLAGSRQGMGILQADGYLMIAEWRKDVMDGRAIVNHRDKATFGEYINNQFAYPIDSPSSMSEFKSTVKSCNFESKSRSGHTGITQIKAKIRRLVETIDHDTDKFVADMHMLTIDRKSMEDRLKQNMASSSFLVENVSFMDSRFQSLFGRSTDMVLKSMDKGDQDFLYLIYKVKGKEKIEKLIQSTSEREEKVQKQSYTRKNTITNKSPKSKYDKEISKRLSSLKSSAKIRKSKVMPGKEYSADLHSKFRPGNRHDASIDDDNSSESFHHDEEVIVITANILGNFLNVIKAEDSSDACGEEEEITEQSQESESGEEEKEDQDIVSPKLAGAKERKLEKGARFINRNSIMGAITMHFHQIIGKAEAKHKAEKNLHEETGLGYEIQTVHPCSERKSGSGSGSGGQSNSNKSMPLNPRVKNTRKSDKVIVEERKEESPYESSIKQLTTVENHDRKYRYEKSASKDHKSFNYGQIDVPGDKNDLDNQMTEKSYKSRFKARNKDSSNTLHIENHDKDRYKNGHRTPEKQPKFIVIGPHQEISPVKVERDTEDDNKPSDSIKSNMRAESGSSLNPRDKKLDTIKTHASIDDKRASEGDADSIGHKMMQEKVGMKRDVIGRNVDKSSNIVDSEAHDKAKLGLNTNASNDPMNLLKSSLLKASKEDSSKRLSLMTSPFSDAVIELHAQRGRNSEANSPTQTNRLAPKNTLQDKKRNTLLGPIELLNSSDKSNENYKTQLDRLKKTKKVDGDGMAASGLNKGPYETEDSATITVLNPESILQDDDESNGSSDNDDDDMNTLWCNIKIVEPPAQIITPTRVLIKKSELVTAKTNPISVIGSMRNSTLYRYYFSKRR
jgi:hypothetical protein